MEMRRDVFQAISDPTRREIIDLLISGNGIEYYGAFRQYPDMF